MVSNSGNAIRPIKNFTNDVRKEYQIMKHADNAESEKAKIDLINKKKARINFNVE